MTMARLFWVYCFFSWWAQMDFLSWESKLPRYVTVKTVSNLNVEINNASLSSPSLHALASSKWGSWSVNKCNLKKLLKSQRKRCKIQHQGYNTFSILHTNCWGFEFCVTFGSSGIRWIMWSRRKLECSCGGGQSREETGSAEVEIWSTKKRDRNRKATGLPWLVPINLQCLIDLSWWGFRKQILNK